MAKTKPLFDLLRDCAYTVSTAESITGGLIADQFVRVHGASDLFRGGIIAYCDKAKQEVLGVRPETLCSFGAVSASCAEEMALLCKKRYDTDFALSTTGYAEPGDESSGLCFIGLAGPRGVRSVRLQLSGGRNAVRQAAARFALYLLHQEMKGIHKHGLQK